MHPTPSNILPSPALPTAADPRCAIGLRRPRDTKHIPIHMLYEHGGSAIYEQIERHPDYYPYEAERRLLAQHVDALIAAIPPGAVLIELGCGDCSKTSILLEALARRDGHAELVGIDASFECLAQNRDRFAARADIRFTAIHDNFFDGLALATQLHQGRELCVMLLGSTIGNMSFDDAQLFLRNMVEMIQGRGQQPRVLLGLDLWKDEDVLRRAYDNDITALFELGGLRNTLCSFDPGHAFDPADWRYVVEINPIANQVEMYAEAQRALWVGGEAIAPAERILLEVSHKFRAWELDRLYAGCEVVCAVGESYRVVLLTPRGGGATNPWMRYGDDDLDDIDRVARLDYAAFAQAYDWPTPDGRPISLLDVGCGSGALPSLLHATSSASQRFAEHIAAYDLLDVSANSLRIAAGRVPFPVGRRYHKGIQDFSNHEHYDEVCATGYDLVWSIHGITAVRHEDLWRSLYNMLCAVRIGGRMLVVMSDHDSHYARIDRAWGLDQAAAGREVRERFLEAEDVVALLAGHGVPCEVVEVRTDHVFAAAEAESWRRFNAWCVYDPDFDVLQGGPAVRAYLEEIRDPAREGYRMRLSSMAISVTRDALTTLRWMARRPGRHLPPLDGEAYARCCAAFEASSTQRQAIVRHMAAQVPLRGLPGQPIRALSLGCGDGRQDLAVLVAALPEGFAGQVFYTGVDASPAQRARCAETLAATEGRLAAAALQGRILDPADLAALPSEEQFEAVFLLHMLYYVDDPRAYLRSALARVAPGGRLVVWHAPYDEMNQIASVFWAPLAGRPIPFAAEVEALLQELGCRATATRIDASLTLPGPGQQGHQDVFSFLIQADAGALAPELRDELARCVDRVCGVDGTMPHPVCCFVVEPS